MSEIQACDMLLKMLDYGCSGLAVVSGGMIVGSRRTIKTILARRRRNNRISRKFNRIWQRELARPASRGLLPLFLPLLLLLLTSQAFGRIA